MGGVMGRVGYSLVWATAVAGCFGEVERHTPSESVAAAEEGSSLAQRTLEAVAPSGARVSLTLPDSLHPGPRVFGIGLPVTP
jgi:hypothetical protein